MRKAYLGIALLILLGLAACNTKPEVPDYIPQAVPTLTPAATPEPFPEEIRNLLGQAKEYKNTVMKGTICTDKKQTNKYVREMSLQYSSFAAIVEDVSFLQSAEEYMTLYPEIENMAIEKLEIYENGICVVFTDVETVFDANLCYAIRTDDRSVLTDTEREVYGYLHKVLEKTGANALNRVEAVKALHDYLVLNLQYDTTYQVLSHSPEGVMKNQTAVCDGYARTMRLLLLLAGIDCKIINGMAGDEAHAWNLVKMEDGWYHVDVTWDDPVPDVEGKVRYLYFLKNDADMARTHTWESEIKCLQNAYQVYLYADVLCDSEDSLREVYERQIETEAYLTFCYPKGGSLSQEYILEFVKNELQSGLTYYPQTETQDYQILEIVNPLWKE